MTAVTFFPDVCCYTPLFANVFHCAYVNLQGPPVKILKTDTLILLFLLTGCSSRVTLQFASDELDRVAITHNENFRPTYLECQTIINELAGAMEASETSERVLDISVLVARES